MELNKFKTLSEATKALSEQGFDKNFKMSDGKLMCLETQEKFDKNNVEIEAFHRFEGTSNPDDMSILYVVECGEDTKGLVTVPFGTYGDSELTNFMRAVEIDAEDN
ncbi:hypothetical protein [Halocola ammonii]